jgi:hypothetical protein
VQLGGYAGIGENGCSACLRGVAVVLGELGFEVRGFHVVVVGRLRIGVDPVTLGHGRPHLTMALHHDINDALVLVAELILVQLAHAQAGLQRDLANTLLELAPQDFHQGGLAAAVGPDQAIAVAIGELDGDAFKERLCTKLNRNVRSNQHLSVFQPN